MSNTSDIMFQEIKEVSPIYESNGSLINSGGTMICKSWKIGSFKIHKYLPLLYNKE